MPLLAIAEAVGLGAACEYLTRIGMDKIYEHEVRTCEFLPSIFKIFGPYYLFISFPDFLLISSHFDPLFFPLFITFFSFNFSVDFSIYFFFISRFIFFIISIFIFIF